MTPLVDDMDNNDARLEVAGATGFEVGMGSTTSPPYWMKKTRSPSTRTCELLISRPFFK